MEAASTDETILCARTLLPVSSPPIHGGGVLMCGGGIREVGKAAELARTHPRARMVDLGDGILMPGLVNAHTHLELGWIRGHIGGFTGFTEWLEQVIAAKREAPPGDDELGRSVQEGIDALIASGVTCVGEVSSYGGADLPYLRSSGLRVVLFRELIDSVAPRWDDNAFSTENLVEARPFPHAPYSCSPSLLARTAARARTRGLPLGIHLAESPEEVSYLRGEPNRFESRVFPLIGRPPYPHEPAPSPLAYVERLGLLDGTRVTLVHMVHVTAEEAHSLSRREAGIVMCPRSNHYLRVGAPPAHLYAPLPRVGLGTDGLSSNFDLDMMAEMRFLYLTSARRLGRGAERLCVYWATLGGARALFIDRKTGSLEPGKRADLIYLLPRHPAPDPYLAVLGCSPEDVKMVMVEGRILRSEGGAWPDG